MQVLLSHFLNEYGTGQLAITGRTEVLFEIVT